MADSNKRPKRDTFKPCAICGWSEHMAIHQPATTKDGAVLKAFGHVYVPIKPANHKKA